MFFQLGGTIGDIESMSFMEAFRQFQFKVQRDNFCCVLVSLVPQVGSCHAFKVGKTQCLLRTSNYLLNFQQLCFSAAQGFGRTKDETYPEDRQGTQRSGTFTRPCEMKFLTESCFFINIWNLLDSIERKMFVSVCMTWLYQWWMECLFQIFCRSVNKLSEEAAAKISDFCHVLEKQVGVQLFSEFLKYAWTSIDLDGGVFQVVSVPDVSSIYRVPLLLEEQNVSQFLKERLNLEFPNPKPRKFLFKWKELAEKWGTFGMLMRALLMLILLGRIIYANVANWLLPLNISEWIICNQRWSSAWLESIQNSKMPMPAC